MFCSIYGETADKVQALLDDSYPDMGEAAFYQLLSVLKPIHYRMVLQYHWLWSNIWIYRGSLPSRDIVYSHGKPYCER